MTNCHNPSKWFSFSLGLREFYSPNLAILELIKKNPDTEFWQYTYTEFAVIIIDKQNHNVICIRDHFGLEPFFYYSQNNMFIFASNIPDLLSVLKNKPGINTAQVLQDLLHATAKTPIYTDETIYQNIYRVEPGCILNFNNQQTQKTKYWHIAATAKPIYYKNNFEYVEHFEELVNQAVKIQAGDATDIAIEFSGGLDSSTVLTSLHNQQINPNLFMHIANPGSNDIDDLDYYGKIVIEQYKLTRLNYINADNFNFKEVMDLVSKIFAGNPAYFFPIGANNIHAAVKKSGHKILFSGFGGDECVSSHAPLYLCLREYLKQQKMDIALHEIYKNFEIKDAQQPHLLKRNFMLLRNSYPHFFDNVRNFMDTFKDYKYKLHNINISKSSAMNSVKELEKEFLIGKYSHHVRLRIEDSAIVAKHMGFQYKYPLLYPPLVEFCHNLPLSLKRQDGENRLIVRKYLSKYLPNDVCLKHQKIGGIMPSTIDKIKKEYQDGCYNNLFTNLPFSPENKFLDKQNHDLQSKIIRNILLYCLKHSTYL